MASSWIWQQPDWPQFRWKGSALAPLLKQARAARQELLSRLERLEPPLDLEVISALLGRESLGLSAQMLREREGYTTVLERQPMVL